MQRYFHSNVQHESEAEGRVYSNPEQGQQTPSVVRGALCVAVISNTSAHQRDTERARLAITVRGISLVDWVSLILKRRKYK